MPRNSGGVYSLYTPGNPVVPSTVISSTWANNTLTDIATALTDSLSRSGDGAMTAPLKLTDGTVSLPGLTWSTETSSGWYREGSNQFAFSISGSKRLGVTTSTLLSQVAGDSSFTLTNSVASITGTLLTEAVNNRLSLGTTTNHGLLLFTAGAGRLSISNAGAVAIPGTLDVTGTLTGTTISASTALNVAGVSVRDATNLFTSGTVPAARLPSSFAGLANPSATIGLTAVNGSASTAIRSDGAPALSQAIAPTWSALHTFTQGEVRSANNSALYSFYNTANTTRSGYIQLTSAGAGLLANEISAGTWSLTTTGAGNIALTPGTGGIATYGGIEIGYRGLPARTFSTSTALLATDAGKIVIFTGAAGQTLTFPSATLASGAVVTVLNAGSGSVTLAAATSQDWYNGTGSLGTGNRTLAIGGAATMAQLNNTAAQVSTWGTGLS